MSEPIGIIDLIQNKAWALHPAKLDEINAFIEARLADPRATFEAARGKSGNKADDRYEIRDGVAVIPVYGVIDKRANMFMEISGGTSTELLKRDIAKALNDRKVDSILLDVDSPGGSVDGTKEVADFIYEARGQKPIIAYANGLMASAAYWIGSAADAIVTNETAMVGSIGVALTHYDRSVNDEKFGVKRTVISAGKYKRIASDEKPLSEEGREYLQSLVDEYFTIFADSVSKNRGADIETVLKKMANGKEYIGKQALKVGLVDYIGNFDTALEMAKEKGWIMDLNALQEKYPELCSELVESGVASVDTAKIAAEAKTEGMTGERARVAEILTAGGDPEATQKAIKDGITADAAYKLFFDAERAKRSEKLDALKDSLPESAGASPKPKGDNARTGFLAQVAQYHKEHDCTMTAALTAVAAKFPELHQAYVDSLNA
jgi:capsid assembly protease